MRRRSTFFHAPQLDINPSQLQLSGNRFFITNLDAAREERLTIGLEELPRELVQVLEQAHEFHLHWATESNYNTSTPLFSRVSPGLHISYTPLREQQNDELCPLLHKILSKDPKCLSPKKTFTTPSLVSSRFASTPLFHYHSQLSSLSRLIAYLQTQVCPHGDPDAERACIHTTSLLSLASTLSISYDSISHALVLTTTWAAPPPLYLDPITGDIYYDAWQAKIDTTAASKVEVGILTESHAADPYELALSGVLTVVGEDTTPQATMFSFPSRHHPVRQSYTVSFDRPTGLHPTMRLSFSDPASLAPPPGKSADSQCALHAYLTLPSVLFPDPYQLSTTDALFLSSHNLVAARSISGETDLEAPDYVLDKWGSNVLLELATPNIAENSSRSSAGTTWDATIPLHLRYLVPSNTSTTSVQIPWPVVFWACTAEEGTKFPVNPFDRVNLGYDGLFGTRTMFYHLDPVVKDGGKLVSTLKVPVLNTEAIGSRWVESGTVVVVLLGWMWVVWKMLGGWKKSGLSTSDKKKKS
jgi:hypothetical protein